MKPIIFVLALSISAVIGMENHAQADQVSLPNGTVTASTLVPETTGTYGGAITTTAPFNAQHASSVVISGKVTGIDYTSQNRSFAEIGLIPRSAWTSNGAWNTGVYIVNWEYQGDALSLSADGVGGPYVWPLQNAAPNKPWNFTITMTPNLAGGGTVTFGVAGEPLIGGPSMAYTGDYSDAILAIQYISTVQNAEFDFIDLVATSTPLALLPGDANNDGLVDANDLIAVEANLGQTNAGDGLLIGDANDDGRVDGNDYISVEHHFGDVLAPPSSSTPEPGSAAVAALSAAGLLIRRR